jgi:hypothetical protein
MTDIVGFLSVAFLLLALAPQEGRAHRGGLPIRYSGEAGIIEVPLETGQLGWQPQPSRTIIIERREQQARADDGPDGEILPEPINRQVPIAVEDRVLKATCFDVRLCGDLTEEKRNVWLLSTLSEKIVAARKRGLSAAEEEKLILAGRGDIKRFFDRIEEMRLEFETVRKDVRGGQLFLLGPEMRSLSIEFQQGPFGDDSFFAKTLAKIGKDHAQERSR